MKMKLLALVTIGLALPICGFADDAKDMKSVEAPTPAPSDAGLYVGALGGSNFSTDYGDRNTTVTVKGTSFNVTPSTVHSDPGAFGGLKLGYKFNSFPVCEGLSLQPAVEGEAMYISAYSSADLSGVATGIRVNTDYDSAAWFVNGILRFKLTNLAIPLTPYIGGGIGGQFITSSSTFNTPTGTQSTSSDDVVFAGQALVGLDYAITPHWSVFTEYKFIATPGADLNASTGGNGTSFKPDYVGQQSAVAGVKYNF